MKLCPHCNNENLDNARFCSFCGKEIVQQQAIPNSQSDENGQNYSKAIVPNSPWLAPLETQRTNRTASEATIVEKTEIKMAECKHCKSTVRYDITRCPNCGGVFPTGYGAPPQQSSCMQTWGGICVAIGIIIFVFMLLGFW